MDPFEIASREKGYYERKGYCTTFLSLNEFKGFGFVVRESMFVMKAQIRIKEWEKMKNSSPNQQSADCRLPPFTKIFCQQSADCWQHVGNLLAKCRPTVGRQSADWLRALSNTRKALARREEHCISTRNETFSLESAILFMFF